MEVLALPAGVDEELLSLYFENKRRSGGGLLASLERRDDCVVLVFEEASAAARVLSKDRHVLSNGELVVRKPAPREQRSPPLLLLLRGINPNTCLEMIELYVENMMGLDAADYALSPAPGRDFIFVRLTQPLSKDFKDLSARISKRSLDGAKVSLEQMDQTDSIYVENLRPGVTADFLNLYFEKQAGGNTVKDVTMLSEGAAKVSFASYDSVGLVLSQPHRMQQSDLVVMPYFDFLQPAPSLVPRDSAVGSQVATERNLKDPGDARAIPAPTSAELMVDDEEEDLYKAEGVDEDEDMDVNEHEDALPGHLSVDEPVKRTLLKLSNFQEDTEKNNPNVKVQVGQSGVHVVGADRQTLERIKRSVLDCLSKVAEARFTLASEEAEFLSRDDVKERLQGAMTESGWPATYSVSDGQVAVTSLSQDSAKRACGFLKSQPGRFSMQVDPQHAGLSCCREWTDFLQALGLAAVTSWRPDGTLEVLTLKGLEVEKKTAIQEFLAAPIERETFLPMELGKLKYLQIHRHQLLADMGQVSIYPLESDKICGLKIHGLAVACQTAEEVLRDLVSTICTKTITIRAPGVTRFLLEEESKSMMKKMETRFEVYIIVKQRPWEPLPQQNIFQTAWTMMSHINFPKVSPGSSVGQLNSMDLDNGGRELLDEAIAVVTACNGGFGEGASGSEQLYDMEDLDLYTDEVPGPSSGLLNANAPDVSGAGGSLFLNGGAHGGVPSSLDEEAQLSLAIQYSMEVHHLKQNEEKQLQDVLELSKTPVQHESPSAPDRPVNKTGDALADAIEAANSIQFVVFAVYLSDLTRVDIAYSKRVDQKQAEEKLEHRTLARMSVYHRRCLEIIKRKHGVEIQVQGTGVTVSGFREYVSEALDDVKVLLDRMSASPSDDEILKVARWVFHDPASSSVTPYSPEVTVFMENVWRAKLKKVDILLDKQLCQLNLETMQEYNTVSRKSVKISRKLVDLGDVNEDVPEEEYSLLSNLPEAANVDEDSDEFQNVVKSFYETIQDYHNKVRIIKVEKLMNRLLYNQYKLKKASILQNATYPQVERTLYHGTSEGSVKEICVHGFNRSFCGKNATVYGQGVYFAVNSVLSIKDQYSPPNPAGYKYIFVSKVLTGDFTKGCHSMKTAPHKETGDIPLRFDSVTDNIAQPTIFVIFNDTQAFPEYLITCQKIGQNVLF